MKRIGFPGEINTLHLQPTSRWAVARVLSAIRVISRAVADDHALALRAATKAASPRRSVAELRAMYVPPLASHR